MRLDARPNHLFAYSGRSLLITNLGGGVTGANAEGFYFENTRVLSRGVIKVRGLGLQPVGVSPVSGAGILGYMQVPGGPQVPEHSVYVRIARVVGDGMRTEIEISNYSMHQDARCELALELAADFADMEEVQQGKREQTGAVETSWDGRELCFRYRHPQLDRAIAIRVEQTPGPVRHKAEALVVSLALKPHESACLVLAAEPIFDGQRYAAPPRVFDEASTPLGRVRQRLRAETPALRTTNPTVTRAWQTATADLASLPFGLDAGPAAPIAGIPDYQQFFGRDTLTISWQSLLAMKGLMRDSLLANAAMQGSRVDDWSDEEPGKLIHQARNGPRSALGIDPFIHYYGDYATPPDFLIMVGQYLAWTGDLETTRACLPAARKAIVWLDEYGDLDHDGFIEYVTRSSKGVKNQGWKDSSDGIVDEEGRIVPNPIATSELQGYWYVGLRQVALAFFHAGDRAYALRLLGQAAALKARFDKAFWMEDEGFYALALGPEKEQVRSIASNAGHLLACGIVPRDKGRRVVQRLMQPDLFSGWGIRTLSEAHPAYNPFSYHLGSVWPVESGTIAFGFARYGCWQELHRLAEGLFASTDLFTANRLPEVLGGLPRDAGHPHPGIYPQSNEPQGWSASTIPLVVQALLGLHPLAPRGLLLLDPQLPSWLPDLRLEGLRVGQAELDLACRRRGDGQTRYRITRRVGRVHVLRQPPPDAGVSLGGRAWVALRSLPQW